MGSYMTPAICCSYTQTTRRNARDAKIIVRRYRGRKLQSGSSAPNPWMLEIGCVSSTEQYLQVPVEPAHIYSSRVPPVVLQRRVVYYVNHWTHDRGWVTCYAVKQRFKPPWNTTHTNTLPTLCIVTPLLYRESCMCIITELGCSDTTTDITVWGIYAKG